MNNEVMEIKVTRHSLRDTYTVGRMEIDGQRFCDTLEDVSRKVESSMPFVSTGNSVGYWMAKDGHRIDKVYGKTAIPTGTYKVSVAYWSKFKVNVPYVHDVPGFKGILIHNGSTAANTEGCVLVGENYAKGQLRNGKKYMVELTQRVQAAIKAGKKVRLTIVEP